MRSTLRLRLHDVALVTATVTVLLCTASLFRSNASSLFTEGGGSGNRVAVFLQKRDCTSNLAFLQLLARPEHSKALTITIYDMDGRRGVKRLATRLRAQDLPFHTRAAPRGSRTALRRMGYRTTPVLVLLGPAGQVLMAAAAPRDAEELRALDQALHLFTGSRLVSR